MTKSQHLVIYSLWSLEKKMNTALWHVRAQFENVFKQTTLKLIVCLQDEINRGELWHMDRKFKLVRAMHDSFSCPWTVKTVQSVAHISELDQAQLPQLADTVVRWPRLEEELHQTDLLASKHGTHGCLHNTKNTRSHVLCHIQKLDRSYSRYHGVRS